jgi:endonuclease G
MNIDDFPALVNRDPKLARVLEAIIEKLRNDDAPRQASPKQKANRRQQLTAQLNDAELATRQLERIMQGNDLTDINYLDIGVQRARSVARVVIRQDRRLLGYATGFLVAPGVLMTNEHVFESADMVKESTVQFQYERNARGMELEPVEFGLRSEPEPIIAKPLDFAIVAVEPLSSSRKTVQEFGWLKLNPAPGKAFVGEYLTIIQHPGGQRKQICVRENKLLKYVDESPFVWYQTDTVGGSSGSPAFNTTWDVVALHHKAIPRVTRSRGKDVWMARNGKPWKEAMGDDEVDWIANEGVRISKILEYLAKAYSGHPLAQAILSAGETPTQESLVVENGQPGGIRVFKDRDGKMKVLVPVEIDLNMNVDLGTAALTDATLRLVPAAPARDGTPGSPPRSTLDEKVEINTSNYDERNGYQPDFLGGGLIVRLPKVAGDTFGKPLKLSGNKTELKYWNYSVVMNADRGLAFFSAGNIMPHEQHGSQDGNQFIRDQRVDDVDERAQIGREFYKKQSTFEEEDRSHNPFDQGHLSRREDLQWGANATMAKRNGDDSFHYTNCAPQHVAFNQNRTISGLWNRLEVSAVQQLSSGEKICIINGPVFNAPVSTAGPDGKLLLHLNGPRKKDPKFGGVSIPKLYFKLIAYRKDDALRAKAFVVSQEDMLATMNRLHEAEASTLSDNELSLYQVKIKDLEDLTGLTFGIPVAADTPHAEELALLEGGRPIYGEEEMFL